MKERKKQKERKKERTNEIFIHPNTIVAIAYLSQNETLCMAYYKVQQYVNTAVLNRWAIRLLRRRSNAQNISFQFLHGG